MSNAPPPYAVAAGQQQAQPAVNITNPGGATHRANSSDMMNKGQLNRMKSNDSMVSSDGGYDPHVSDLKEDDRISMSDEMRDLPKGWVRCFDPK